MAVCMEAFTDTLPIVCNGFKSGPKPKKCNVGSCPYTKRWLLCFFESGKAHWSSLSVSVTILVCVYVSLCKAMCVAILLSAYQSAYQQNMCILFYNFPNHVIAMISIRNPPSEDDHPGGGPAACNAPGRSAVLLGMFVIKITVYWWNIVAAGIPSISAQCGTHCYRWIGF